MSTEKFDLYAEHAYGYDNGRSSSGKINLKLIKAFG